MLLTTELSLQPCSFFFRQGLIVYPWLALNSQRPFYLCLLRAGVKDGYITQGLFTGIFVLCVLEGRGTTCRNPSQLPLGGAWVELRLCVNLDKQAPPPAEPFYNLSLSLRVCVCVVFSEGIRIPRSASVFLTNF